MSTELDDARKRATAAYDAAADFYDDAANTFWSRFGQRTIDRLDLKAGHHVLDVCCGSGASAIPAAQRVAPDGSVIGVDLSARLLGLARAKAASRGLSNAEFRVGDMLDHRMPDAHFDAVVCVFGIFFVPDMAAAVRSLWRAVRPGGKLAITTWGPRFFEPVNTAFWSAVREVRPDLYRGFNPWDRITEPSAVRALLRDAGIIDADVVAESGEHPIASPQAWWAAVLGSGFRGTIEQLDAAQRERVRASNFDYIHRAGIRSIEANVVYAIATKPR
jgi:ubiquinone/menaquinone biosynthesis C-methylase UbiE